MNAPHQLVRPARVHSDGKTVRLSLQDITYPFEACFLKGHRTCQNVHTHFFSSGVGIHLVLVCGCWVWIHSLPSRTLDSRTGQVTQQQTKSRVEDGIGTPWLNGSDQCQVWNTSPLVSPSRDWRPHSPPAPLLPSSLALQPSSPEGL